MDDDILTIALANLIFGALALTVGYLYTLPREHPMTPSAAIILATGEP
ncbi:hypothetical protein [Pararhizobium sp. O133]